MARRKSIRKSKTTFKWYTKPIHGKRHLTKKAKAYLSKIAFLNKAFRRLAKAKLENIKYIIHFKAIYNSDRGLSHDFFCEGELTIVTPHSLSETQIKNIIYERLSSGEFETDSAFKDFYDRMTYTDIEIGYERTLTNEEPKEELEVHRYGYRIET